MKGTLRQERTTKMSDINSDRPFVPLDITTITISTFRGNEYTNTCISQCIN